VRQLLERQFARLTVVGEVSNLRVVGGHRYFSLKDDRSQLAAVLFRREAARLGFELTDGAEVLGTGKLSLYGPRGTFQIILDQLELRGAGALQAAFEELKRKLTAEGLFARERKRSLPWVPRRVAVVTSPSGAVIRDIVHVATRRFPGAQLLLVPAKVQGAEAGGALAFAITQTSRLASKLGLDVMIVARGGGSLEDLWGFNDERVARAIAAAPIPVVSAVGHETDVTIADFVADCRAPTPSAAAELVFPRRQELVAELHQRVRRSAGVIQRNIERDRHRLRAAVAALGDGRGMVAVQTQRLNLATAAVAGAAAQLLGRRRAALAALENRLAHLHPRVHLREVQATIGAVRERIGLLAGQRIERGRQRLAAAEGRVAALSPLGVLERGYAIALAANGRAVRDAAELRRGDRVDVRVARGRFAAVVDETEGEG
jgi:exodeoxyribonuclease VII large subunit